VFQELNNIGELYKLFVQFPFVSTDTRNIIPNSLFFCLKGEKFDGNQFVVEALEKGARYVVTERRFEMEDLRFEMKDLRKLEPSDIAKSHIAYRIIVVDDVLETLQQLAAYHRRQLKTPVIGITGSNGKTTTKELIAAVLSKKYKTTFTQGNLNNHIGVPLTLLSTKKDDEIAVIELGANHTGEIEELCKIAQPDYGIITNIGKAHLEGFGTIENIIETKTALYRAAPILFVNAEDELLTHFISRRFQPAEHIRRDGLFYYGKNTEYNAEIVEMNPCLVINLFGNKIQTQLPGNYNLPNILGATAIGDYFGISTQDICDAIAEYKPQNQRSQIIKTTNNTIIADYYNANPTSMQAALNNFIQIETPKRLAILGDMLELGENSKIEHKNVVNFCKNNSIETLFIGSVFHSLKEEHFHFFMNVEECNYYLKSHSIKDSFILIKGSRGIHLEEIILSL
jgi:UDP-N-acetylmuramoyl-tripeptide--D-alanyl-D-alanine ligase